MRAVLTWTGVALVGLVTLAAWTALWLYVGHVVEERTKPDQLWQPGAEGLGVPVAVIGWLAWAWVPVLICVGALVLDAFDWLRGARG
jgi:hypothetical protein